jgi:uncharacterized phage-associated protein
MANVIDVAAFILANAGEMTAWKLQKLVYYGQAWSLVWDEKPLFSERIEAWANGPVCPDLYNRHRGLFVVSQLAGGDPRRLTDDEVETLVAVLKYYGGHSAQELSDLTHSEAPWKDARSGLAPGAPSTREITHEAMAAFYESLPPGT